MRKIFLIIAVFWIWGAQAAGASQITDGAGRRHSFNAPPDKVVSLVPAATEIICLLGEGRRIAGVTLEDAGLEDTAGKTVVGREKAPLFGIIKSLAPDLLIVAPDGLEAASREMGEIPCAIFATGGGSLADAEKQALAMGEIFGRQAEAKAIIDENNEFFSIIRDKINLIPKDKRQKTTLLSMGRDGLLMAGGDSFQTEIITAAGGAVPCFALEGPVPVSLEQWREFNPGYVFAAGPDYAAVKKFLEQDGWRDADAVKNGRIRAFPDALVNRAAAHTGYFTAWLSSDIYADEFADEKNTVRPREIVSERVISLDVPYVKSARIVESRIRDFKHRTLLVDFRRPQRVISTNSGERGGVMTVGNSYSPTPTWGIYHKLGFDQSQADLFETLGLDKESAEIMLTGADMNNLSVKTASYRDMSVTAMVTAGAESNAIRTSRDTGAWYEPGTINILVMTNHKLAERAATRAIITVTEAKTAALWDMDIRSAQNRAFYPATGTGTDTALIVSGEGVPLSNSGGHSKIGELIADTVYRGVQEALLKQNGKAPARNAAERLEERAIWIGVIAPDCQAEIEEMLLSPEYAWVSGFLESAFSLSDAHMMGQISDLSPFGAWALSITEKIAGKPVGAIQSVTDGSQLTPALKIALDAIITGIRQREGK